MIIPFTEVWRSFESHLDQLFLTSWQDIGKRWIHNSLRVGFISKGLRHNDNRYALELTNITTLTDFNHILVRNLCSTVIYNSIYHLSSELRCAIDNWSAIGSNCIAEFLHSYWIKGISSNLIASRTSRGVPRSKQYFLNHLKQTVNDTFLNYFIDISHALQTIEITLEVYVSSATNGLNVDIKTITVQSKGFIVTRLSGTGNKLLAPLLAASYTELRTGALCEMQSLNEHIQSRLHTLWQNFLQILFKQFKNVFLITVKDVTVKMTTIFSHQLGQLITQSSFIIIIGGCELSRNFTSKYAVH